MRTLIYVPIIHSVADMGSLAVLQKQKKHPHDEPNRLQKHADSIDAYWKVIESYFDNVSLDLKGVNIYQDAMFAEGEMAMTIIREGIKNGSKNSEIVFKLIGRGANLVQTEDFKLIKEEYDGVQAMFKAKTNLHKLFYLLRYKLLKSGFLVKRDRYISSRIADTLGFGETGILFIGAYHNIKKRLPKDITVIELKEITKIRSYQKMAQSTFLFKPLQYKKLADYLTKKPESINLTVS